MAILIQHTTDAQRYDGIWKWQAAGMCYVVKSDGGRLIVIDGGHAVDSESLISLLEREGGECPTVDMWILTHPHGDHIACLADIACDADKRSRLRILSVVAAYPEMFRPANGKSYRKEKERMDAIRNGISAVHITPMPGNIFTVDGIKIEILGTYHALEEPKNINDLSTVFMLSTKDTRVLFTGDATERTVAPILESCKDSLGCDMIQISHHALDGASVPFYKAAGAKIALVPMSKSGHDAMQGPKFGNITAPARYAIRHARTVFYAYMGETVLPI